ncbi:uncharacterized protein LOC119658290 isoform X2 [Hermetia illucens]|uniref:uncharacterized protein LOC119658290 isoform X2 n=1 Tax=Hermetia illucens TaxID=343691 RepID=UPI0018CC4A18|nr:uncharacterized protein LOC119658290 isoform X2 [Hermetia illucens]
MKVNGRGFSWFSLLLLGSCVMSVLPSNSTTSVTTFQPSTMTMMTRKPSKGSVGAAPLISTKQNDYIMDITPTSQITSSSYQEDRIRIESGSITNPHPVGRRWTKSVHAKRDVQPEVPDPCDVFERDEPNTNMFYSPGYPNNYPNNSNCVRILQAPSGQILRLDFRDKFDIEPSEGCKFDFLEIRDGGYGYSNLLGKFCGRDFPPMITSKERYLWLHFHSDDNIEYSGFTAVYDFIPKPTSSLPEDLVCRIYKGGFEGFVNNTDVPENITEIIREHKIATDCMWVITVKEGWKIQLNFLQFNLKRPNECDVNFVDIFPDKTDEHSKLRNFCGSAADSINSLTNVLHVRYYAEYVAYNSSFTILYTAFRDKGAACEEDEYDCEDATCISAELQCNGRNNCRFRWDEDECHTEDEGQSEHVIIIIVVFGLILGGMMITFCVNCIRKLLRDQKIIREHIRQSKESKLDEMGRASAKRSRENLSKITQLTPNSLQILDDVSNRYYREAIPIAVQNSRSDSKSDTILRQQHDMVIQTSLGDDTPVLDQSGTCDMGCQTRESLFQPVQRQKSTTVSPHQSGLRFSTFGYDTPPTSTNQSLKAQKFSSSKEKSNTAPTTIEMEDLSHTEIPTKPYEICHHHHQHQQHLQQLHQKQHQPQSGGKGGKQKMEESRAFIDIRNSAPDVIIMTSH